jgi:pyruvate formate lyase activating enzyme
MYLKQETNVWFEITNLLIPDENDSEKEIDEMCQWVMANLGADVPLHFIAFHPDWKMRDKSNTSAAVLTRSCKIARENGLRYVYTGNVHDAEGVSTICHGCGEILIGRNWYVLGAWQLTKEGACAKCGTPCSGVFEEVAGSWGAKREAVRLL